MKVPFREAFLFWLKLGFINFGGPTGQIAVMQEELVEKRKWISLDRFLHALNYCMLLPGPEAQQLAVYVGWLLHRTLGGLVAGVFFILPGSLLMLALSWVYAAHGSVGWVASTFQGLRAAVIAIVAAAVIRVGKKALRNRAMVVVAALSFVLIFFLHVPFPLLVLGAGIVGLIGGLRFPQVFNVPSGHGAGASSSNRDDVGVAETAEPVRPTAKWAALVLVIGLGVWWLPLGAVIAWRGESDTLSQQALFFSKAAMVTFGGAYAVLTYVDQQAVEHYGWLDRGQMAAGLGLAESTPGPLILVTQFVGFQGAYRNPGGLDPTVAGVLGSLVTTWATFAPCFLWIFLGAPFIELLRGNRHLTAALSTITAAVAGVILNLAVVLAAHTIFPGLESGRVPPLTIALTSSRGLDVFSLGLAALGFYALWRRKWGLLPVVAASVAAGWVGYWISVA